MQRMSPMTFRSLRAQSSWKRCFPKPVGLRCWEHYVYLERL